MFVFRSEKIYAYHIEIVGYRRAEKTAKHDIRDWPLVDERFIGLYIKYNSDKRNAYKSPFSDCFLLTNKRTRLHCKFKRVIFKNS